MNRYCITFSSGTPEWKTTKWIIASETRSDAMHKALLMHNNSNEFDVNMVTLSKKGTTDIDLSGFIDLDLPEHRETLRFLESIWRQKFNKLENV